MKKTIVYLSLAFCLLNTHFVFADFGGGGGQSCDCDADPFCDPSCDPDVAVPIDGGISLLVAGGIALGVVYKKRTKKDEMID